VTDVAKLYAEYIGFHGRTIIGSAYPGFIFDDGILPDSSSKLRLLVINLASVPGGQLVNYQLHNSLYVGCYFSETIHNRIMTHSEEFLNQLAKEKVIGDFPPFDTGDIDEVEKYIKAIIGRLKDNYQIIVEPDFNYYGSGFASYINVRISKKDKSDTKTTQDKNKLTHWTKGLLFYISNLTPYWYYGASEWTVSTENGKYVGGSSGYLRPESIDQVDNELWSIEIEKAKAVFDQFRYRLLTKEEVEKQVNFDTTIRTVLADKPYDVFDFFFHWED
jgi:hypothetical protein